MSLRSGNRCGRHCDHPPESSYVILEQLAEDYSPRALGTKSQLTAYLISVLSWRPEHKTRYIHANLKQARAGGNVQRLKVRVSEGYIGNQIHHDRNEVDLLPFR